jgi:hypothetical protein
VHIGLSPRDTFSVERGAWRHVPPGQCHDIGRERTEPAIGCRAIGATARCGDPRAIGRHYPGEKLTILPAKEALHVSNGNLALDPGTIGRTFPPGLRNLAGRPDHIISLPVQRRTSQHGET